MLTEEERKKNTTTASPAEPAPFVHLTVRNKTKSQQQSVSFMLIGPRLRERQKHNNKCKRRSFCLQRSADGRYGGGGAQADGLRLSPSPAVAPSAAFPTPLCRRKAARQGRSPLLLSLTQAKSKTTAVQMTKKAKQQQRKIEKANNMATLSLQKPLLFCQCRRKLRWKQNYFMDFSKFLPSRVFNGFPHHWPNLLNG